MVSVLLRFRAFKYACSSDIMKAFLMVELEEGDRDFTRFMWPQDPYDPNSKIEIYRFRVVLFGATCSQFLLNISIKNHLERFNCEIANKLDSSLYVDNVLHSSSSEEDMIKFFKTSTEFMNKS